MIDIIEQQIEAAGDKVKTISVKSLHSIIQDIESIKNTGWLNDSQKFIVNDLYEFALPTVSFEINSVIIVASPSHSVNLTFNKSGKKVSAILPPTYVDYNSAPKRVEKYLNELMNPYGYHICPVPPLPLKLLAVRSGLSKYGRNNISYIDGIGSFYKLVAFYSDIPCDKEDLYGISRMDNCKNCTLCLKNCPTKAILESRFLIDSQRCLTHFNEEGGMDFPEWIDESAHNSIYGCIQCQSVCPYNREHLKSTIGMVEFTEYETDMLLKENSFESYPCGLKEKIENLGMESFLSAIPRNLKIFIDRV